MFMKLCLASFFRQEALAAFRSGPGAAKSALLEENRARLKVSKRRAKELGLSINGAKRELDTLKQKAEELKSIRQSQTGEGAGQVGTLADWRGSRFGT